MSSSRWLLQQLTLRAYADYAHSAVFTLATCSSTYPSAILKKGKNKTPEGCTLLYIFFALKSSC